MNIKNSLNRVGSLAGTVIQGINTGAQTIRRDEAQTWNNRETPEKSIPGALTAVMGHSIGLGAKTAGLYKGVAKYAFGRAGTFENKYKSNITNNLQNHGILGLTLRGAAYVTGSVLGAAWDGASGAKTTRALFVKVADHAAQTSRVATQTLPQMHLMGVGILVGTLATAGGALATAGWLAAKHSRGGLKGMAQGIRNDWSARPSDASHAESEPSAPETPSPTHAEPLPEAGVP